MTEIIHLVLKEGTFLGCKHLKNGLQVPEVVLEISTQDDDIVQVDQAI